ACPYLCAPSTIRGGVPPQPASFPLPLGGSPPSHDWAGLPRDGDSRGCFVFGGPDLVVETGVALPVETTDYLPVGRGKRARRAYGFDEVALVPGRVTINPEESDITVSLG